MKISAMLVLAIVASACSSTKVKLVKPNFEKVDDSKSVLLFPLKTLSVNDNQNLFAATISKLDTAHAHIHFFPNMEWELRKMYVNVSDTADYKKLIKNGIGYFLVVDVLKHKDPAGFDYLTNLEIQQSLGNAKSIR